MASALTLLLVPACGGSSGTDPLPPGEAGQPAEPVEPSIDPGPYTPGLSYYGRNGYVEYVAGDLPLILLAAHGGDREPVEIPPRTAFRCGGSATTVTDLNTIELAQAVADALAARVGRRPHLVVNHLDRSRLDANRDLEEAACGNPAAEAAWQEFHRFVEVAREAVRSTAGGGLLVDVHGHGHDIQRLELGYRVSADALALPDAVLDTASAVIRTTSVRALVDEERTLSALLRGPSALGSLYAREGVRAVPSSADPHPGGAPYFRGGYNTRRWGCGVDAQEPEAGVCAIQLEANFAGVRDDASARARFGRISARVLERYLEETLGLTAGGT